MADAPTPDLIDQLGGPVALAGELSTSPNAVYNWKRRGIPWRKRHVIARLAAERGVKLPDDFWREEAA